MLWVITWVGSFAPGSFFVGSQHWGHPCDNGVTHVRRLANVKNPFSLEASVALRGGSTLVIAWKERPRLTN